MNRRGSSLVVGLWAGLAAALAGCIAVSMQGRAGTGVVSNLVARLGLTDVALLNEARYVRNPALADLHSAFQDGPGSLEHFPTGALTVPTTRGLGGRVETTEP